MRVLLAVLSITCAFLWGMHFGYKLAISDTNTAVSTSETFRLVPKPDLCALLKAPCLNGQPVLAKPHPRGYVEI